MANSYTGVNGVYRNKLGLTDAAELKRFEYRLTTQRSSEILEKTALDHLRGYDLEHQQAIHQHIFQDVYEWAGKVRTVPSSKSVGNGMVSVFADPDVIHSDWQALEKKTNAFVNAKNLAFEQKRNMLTDLFIEANRIHPFPEGNGRSLQIFMKLLAREQGVELDYSQTTAQEWNRASALSGTYGELFERKYLIPSPPNPEPIKKIFIEIASPSRAQKREEKHGSFKIPDDYRPSPDAIAAIEPLRAKGIDECKVRAAMYGIDTSNQIARELGIPQFQARILDSKTTPLPQEKEKEKSAIPTEPSSLTPKKR